MSDGRYKYIAWRNPESITTSLKSGLLGQGYAPNHFGRKQQFHASIAMEAFPAYFDHDQLYDLKEDPYEQRNLAYLPQKADELARMKGLLEQELSSFAHPFDLKEDPYYRSEDYMRLTEKTLELGTSYIPWWQPKKYPSNESFQ